MRKNPTAGRLLSSQCVCVQQENVKQLFKVVEVTKCSRRKDHLGFSLIDALINSKLQASHTQEGPKRCLRKREALLCRVFIWLYFHGFVSLQLT